MRQVPSKIIGPQQPMPPLPARSFRLYVLPGPSSQQNGLFDQFVHVLFHRVRPSSLTSCSSPRSLPGCLQGTRENTGRRGSHRASRYPNIRRPARFPRHVRHPTFFRAKVRPYYRLSGSTLAFCLLANIRSPQISSNATTLSGVSNAELRHDHASTKQYAHYRARLWYHARD